jgi:CheY-like chemotaxis protein
MTGPFRIFVVEDEMMIALMIEDMVADLGHHLSGVAMRLPQALEMAKDVQADVAILDINLDGRR